MPRPKPRGRPFKPGQSGNPAGRKPGATVLSDCLRELASQPGPGGLTHAQRLAAVIWRRAEAGDMRAAALIADRLEGKPGQRVEVAGLDFSGGGISGAVMRASAELEAADREAEAKAKGGGNRQ